MSNALELPYELHTGRELELMLRGTKPLSHFYDEYPADRCEEIIPEKAFAPFVDNGVFEKLEYVEPLTKPSQPSHVHVKGIRHVFYALPAEAWRIDAYIEMQLRLAPAGWSLKLERLQGSLLGYEDWQTEIHLEMWRARTNAHQFPWLFDANEEAAETKP
jgi:hypothetical protein